MDNHYIYIGSCCGISLKGRCCEKSCKAKEACVIQQTQTISGVNDDNPIQVFAHNEKCRQKKFVENMVGNVFKAMPMKIVWQTKEIPIVWGGGGAFG